FGELVNGEANAVIGDTVLREIVGANFLATVSAPDHGFTFFRQCILLLLHLDFVQAGAQHAHGFLAILNLGLLVLAADHRVGWNVGDTHGGVSRVDRLSAGAGGTERVDTNIFGIDLDVDVFGFGKNGDGYSRSM